jgi:hypothetical protein
MHLLGLKTKSLLVAAASFIAAYAYGQTPVQPETTTSSSGGLAHHQLRVINATPWYCRLATVTRKAKNFVELGPGETASTAAKGGGKQGMWTEAIPFASKPFVWYAQSADIVVTLAALFYSDPTKSQYIGAAVSAVPTKGAGTSSFSSVLIKPENVWLADDVDRSRIPAVLTGRLNQAEKPLKVNYTSAEGAGIQMFVWNSETPADVMLDRSAQGKVRKGDVYYVSGHTRTRITFTVAESNGYMRTWEQTFADDGAHVFVLGIHDLH